MKKLHFIAYIITLIGIFWLVCAFSVGSHIEYQAGYSTQTGDLTGTIIPILLIFFSACITFGTYKEAIKVRIPAEIFVVLILALLVFFMTAGVNIVNSTTIINAAFSTILFGLIIFFLLQIVLQATGTVAVKGSPISRAVQKRLEAKKPATEKPDESAKGLAKGSAVDGVEIPMAWMNKPPGY